MSFTPQEFYFSYGLYQKLPFVEDDFEKMFRLVFPIGRLDLHCPYCQKETTFEPFFQREKTKAGPIDSSKDIYSFDDFKANFSFNYFSNSRRFDISYKCIREPYSSHLIYFKLQIEDSSLMKIGQYPSIADLSNYSIKHYESVLPKEYYRELVRAIGLFSHGVGIGSFVYMRRIFERLIFDTYDEHKTDIEISHNDFRKMRMNEKIGALSTYLPRTLVEKKALYSVLSKGIHELDENTCKKYFPIVRAGIEFILDEKIHLIAQKAKESKFSNEFDDMIKSIK